MYKCTLQTGFQSFTELDEVVQSLATGEIADSVREIASFRTKIKDIGSKVRGSYLIFCRSFKQISNNIIYSLFI